MNNNSNNMKEMKKITFLPTFDTIQDPSDFE